MPYAGEISALTTALCWSLTSILFSEAGRRIGSFQVNAIRLLLAVAIYSVVLLVTRGRVLPADLQADQVIILALSGLISLVIGDSCGFKAMIMIGPRLSSLVWGTAPIWTVMIAWAFLGERLALVHLAGIAITVGGVSWVLTERRLRNLNHFDLAGNHPDSGTLMRGVLLATLAALGQAVGLVLAKHAMLSGTSTLDPMIASFLRMLPAALLIWILVAIRGRLGSTLRHLTRARIASYMAGGAILGPFFGHWTSLIAVTYIPAGIAATLNNTVPIWIIPIVILYYHEKVSLRSILGAILAVMGVAILFLADEIPGLF